MEARSSMTDSRQPYEPPSVEEIDNDGYPISTAAGNSIPGT
jgi:hypothetical protein